MKEDGPIIEAYENACSDAKAKGSTPVVVVDETLWECLILNSDPDNDGSDNYGFDREKVLAYRSAMLKESLPDPKELLADLISSRMEDAAEDEVDWMRM